MAATRAVKRDTVVRTQPEMQYRAAEYAPATFSMGAALGTLRLYQLIRGAPVKMRNMMYAAVLVIPFIVATSFSAVAGCDAPYTGCLAACGNKVTGGTTGGSPGTLKSECKAKCLAIS